MYARRAARASGKPPPQIRIFVLYHDPAFSKVGAAFGGHAERPRGRGARLRGRGDDALQQHGHRARDPAHARRHRTNTTRRRWRRCIPSATRSRTAMPRFPQTFAEIMAGRYAVDAQTFEMPESLDRVRRGRFHRARNPLDPGHERRCSKPRSCESQSRAACSSTRSTAPSAPANSSRCWVAMAPANRCCCARSAGLRAPTAGSCARRPRHHHARASRDRACGWGSCRRIPTPRPRGRCAKRALLGRFAHLGFWEAAGAADAQRVAQALVDVGLEALRASANSAPCRAANNAAPPSPACWCRRRLSTCSTSPPITSIPRSSSASSTTCAALTRDGRRGHRQPARAESRVALCGPRLPAVGQRRERAGRLRGARHRITSTASTVSATSKRVSAHSASWRRAEAHSSPR